MVKVSFGLSLCWVECLWATWAASAVHVVNMVLKPSTLDMVQRAGEISVHSLSSFAAASAVVGVVVDMMVDVVYFLRQMFRVRWLAEWVVAPAVLSYCCGPSLAALWVAAASASGLMLWASGYYLAGARQSGVDDAALREWGC